MRLLTVFCGATDCEIRSASRCVSWTLIIIIISFSFSFLHAVHDCGVCGGSQLRYSTVKLPTVCVDSLWAVWVCLHDNCILEGKKKKSWRFSKCGVRNSFRKLKTLRTSVYVNASPGRICLTAWNSNRTPYFEIRLTTSDRANNDPGLATIWYFSVEEG